MTSSDLQRCSTVGYPSDSLASCYMQPYLAAPTVFDLRINWKTKLLITVVRVNPALIRSKSDLCARLILFVFLTTA